MCTHDMCVHNGCCFANYLFFLLKPFPLTLLQLCYNLLPFTPIDAVDCFALLSYHDNCPCVILPDENIAVIAHVEKLVCVRWELDVHITEQTLPKNIKMKFREL